MSFPPPPQLWPRRPFLHEHVKWIQHRSGSRSDGGAEPRGLVKDNKMSCQSRKRGREHAIIYVSIFKPGSHDSSPPLVMHQTHWAKREIATLQRFILSNATRVLEMSGSTDRSADCVCHLLHKTCMVMIDCVYVVSWIPLFECRLIILGTADRRVQCVFPGEVWKERSFSHCFARRWKKNRGKKRRRHHFRKYSARKLKHVPFFFKHVYLILNNEGLQTKSHVQYPSLSWYRVLSVVVVKRWKRSDCGTARWREDFGREPLGWCGGEVVSLTGQTEGVLEDHWWRTEPHPAAPANPNLVLLRHSNFNTLSC